MDKELITLVPTREEISFIANIDEMTYTDLVDTAKNLLRKRDLIALKIAKMACKACTIRHGGRSTGYYTMTDFANDVGMSYKTLSNWTICYRTVAMKIEEHIKSNKDWDNARKLSDRLIKERTILRKQSGMNKGEKSKFIEEVERPAKEIFELFEAMSENTSQLQECSTNIKRALFNIRNVKTKAVSIDDNFLYDISETIEDFILIAQSIQNRCIELIGSKSGLRDLK